MDLRVVVEVGVDVAPPARSRRDIGSLEFSLCAAGPQSEVYVARVLDVDRLSILVDHVDVAGQAVSVCALQEGFDRHASLFPIVLTDDECAVHGRVEFCALIGSPDRSFEVLGPEHDLGQLEGSRDPAGDGILALSLELVDTGSLFLRDLSFGDLAVDMGLLENEQLVQALKVQLSRRLPIGQALVRLGHVGGDRLGLLLDAYKADQAQYDVGTLELPDGLVSHRVSQYVVELFPRFMLRVARMQVKIGEVHRCSEPPDFAEIRVSVPIASARGVDVALICDLAFGESLAEAASGLDPADLDAEMVADGVGEFLNVLCGNAASAVAKEGHPAEIGPPDYEAELCDGWMVEIATDVGRAALVLSTF